ncbi:hypothetical protein JKY79_01650, partial [Candidatus Babeliales bacterium]|nr:hypothetical protein [Candidatus Babeliales bacterium]
MLYLYFLLSFIFVVNHSYLESAGFLRAGVVGEEKGEDGKKVEKKKSRYQFNEVANSIKSIGGSQHSDDEEYGNATIVVMDDDDAGDIHVNRKFEEEVREIGRDVNKWKPLIKAMYEASLQKRSNSIRIEGNEDAYVTNAVEDILNDFGQEVHRGMPGEKDGGVKGRSASRSNKIYLRSVIEQIIVEAIEEEKNPLE